ncbi:MAG: hypothetical protein Q8Q73_13215 [Stagnimonas sp.]|nr:hypothetical protein [Stagnimonas sp.]
MKTDLEIYQLSSEILFAITGDLSKGIYKKLGGSLQISWNTENRVSAWAISDGDPLTPPQHKIVVCYELARRLYRDVEDFHIFAIEALLREPFESFFKDFSPKPRLPPTLESHESVHNMFIGALTWVFFHELAHLNQEHGHIRSKCGGQPNRAGGIEDCESDGDNALTGKAALISHVTEFAADVEAFQHSLQELARHFLSKDLDDGDPQQFRDNLFLLVCGISCALYRFNGVKIVQPHRYPVGSHPTPLRRLEVGVPNIFEKLDLGGRGKSLHNLSRKELVYLCSGAAYSAGFFWLWRYAKGTGIPDNFLAKGLLQDDKLYWREILSAWDEIEPEIIKIRRFGNKQGLLYFTDDFRSKILSA